MSWISAALFLFGGSAALAWFGAQEPAQTLRRKVVFGSVAFVALSTALVILLKIQPH
jgi:preprotein translocase subunit SecG